MTTNPMRCLTTTNLRLMENEEPEASSQSSPIERIMTTTHREILKFGQTAISQD